MQKKAHNNEWWTTLICIDSYEDGVLNGKFYNHFLDGPQEFRSLSQFLVMMESTLDAMQLPQAFNALRSFSVPLKLTAENTQELKEGHGLLATFSIRILFRQNTSWQGTILWLDRGQTERFRSVLELVLLMDSALRNPAAFSDDELSYA